MLPSSSPGAADDVLASGLATSAFGRFTSPKTYAEPPARRNGRELHWLAQVELTQQQQQQVCILPKAADQICTIVGLQPARLHNAACSLHFGLTTIIVSLVFGTFIVLAVEQCMQDHAVKKRQPNHSPPPPQTPETDRLSTAPAVMAAVPSPKADQATTPPAPAHMSGRSHTPDSEHLTTSEAVPSEDSFSRLNDSMAKSIVMSQQLELLTERMPISGQAVTSIICLMDLCVAARPVAQNARELARLCLDVIDIVEDLVDFGDILTPNLFRELHKAFQTAAAHVELFVRPGWLIHLALMEDVKGHFESIHQLIVDILQNSIPEGHLAEVLAHKRQYTDPARPMLRVLRQIGDGDVVEGMYAAKTDTVHVHAIVHALTPPSVSGVDDIAVRKELKGLPPKTKNIDLERMYRTGAAGSLTEVKSELGPSAVAGLRRVYKAFATYGQRYNGAIGLDGARWLKLTQDCGFVGRGQKLRNTDVDLVFAKVRTKGERVLSFEQFIEALDALGHRCGMSLADIATKCLASNGPVTRATIAANVRFHDDKSTYTGTWAHGGGPPTAYDGPRDLGAQLSRDIKTERRRSAGQCHDHRFSRFSMAAGGQRQSASGKSAASRPPLPDPLQEKFVSFAIFGKGAAVADAAADDPDSVVMDSKGFAKLCKEAQIMCGNLDLTRVDLSFTKCSNKVTKRLDFRQFQAALELCADARGWPVESVTDAVSNCEGPIVHGTQAQAVRFHDKFSTTRTPRASQAKPQLFTKDGRPVWQEK